MKKILFTLPFLLSSPAWAQYVLTADKICSGQTVAGIHGTANCGTVPYTKKFTEGIYVLSGRKDIEFLPLDTDFNYRPLIFPVRTSLYLSDIKSLADFNSQYSVLPLGQFENDGHTGSVTSTEVTPISYHITFADQRSHWGNIAKNLSGIDRNGLLECGLAGTISERISNCSLTNPHWAFYDGNLYGELGEGDWSLVAVKKAGSRTYEVWRDERTKLIWSDYTQNDYNWYQASGYTNSLEHSLEDNEEDASPGSAVQPSNPVSVCAEVFKGSIVAGGGKVNNYQNNPETVIKGNLNINQVIWKLPSLSEYKMAEVNGLRKVLPNPASNFWSSTSATSSRSSAWRYTSSYGLIGSAAKNTTAKVRCVGYPR